MKFENASWRIHSNRPCRSMHCEITRISQFRKCDKSIATSRHIDRQISLRFVSQSIDLKTRLFHELGNVIDSANSNAERQWSSRTILIAQLAQFYYTWKSFTLYELFFQQFHLQCLIIYFFLLNMQNKSSSITIVVSITKILEILLDSLNQHANPILAKNSNGTKIR